MVAPRDVLKDLFNGALDRPPAEREAFLVASHADAAVIREVQALLVAHEKAGSFLEDGLPSELLPAPTLSPGQRLGPYEVVELIGVGSMGEVYSARDTRLGRQVAIKVLPHAYVGDKARQQRLEEEARAASALNHPNVLTVYDVGTLSATEGSAFLVMELLEGHTLRTRLQGSAPLSRERAVDYGAQVARGLTAAHAAGIVHRDLKPENLFLTTDGRVKILDFGVAKLTRPDDFGGTTTQPGTIIGTPGYMAPEQVRGQGADARSDIFALGTVLFEMLTGRRAFAGGSSIDTLSAILHADPVQDHPTIGRDTALGTVLRRCMAKAPADRYQDAAEVVVALEHAAREPQRGTVSRARLATLAAAPIVLAILAGILWQQRLASPVTPVAVEKSQTRVLAVLPFENISEDQSQQYFVNGMTEELAAQLARLSSLHLMSRAAVAPYRDAPDATKRMREELGVNALLTGSVRLAEGRARISVQLVDTQTSRTIWAQQYDQKTNDILQVQGDVGRQIVAALQATLSDEDRKRLIQRSTSNPAAYELYLKATDSRAGPPGIALLKEAVRLDPKFAVAYAALSRMQGEVGAYGDPQLHADALASAQKAIEMDPNEARGHHALATINFRIGHLTDARTGYARALELAPNLPEAAWDLSATDATLGRLDESLFWARRGFTLAPNLVQSYYHLAIPIAMFADSDATVRWLRSAEERFPGSGRIQYLLAAEELYSGHEEAAQARVRRALAADPTDAELQVSVAEHAFLREAADAPARIEELFKQSPDAGPFLLAATFRTLHAYHLHKRGDTQRAAVLFNESLAAAHQALETGSEGSLAPLEIAAIHAVRGERHEALQWLETAYRAGDREFRGLKRDPFFSTLRQDPEFLRISQAMENDVTAQRQRVDLDDNPPLPPLSSTGSPALR